MVDLLLIDNIAESYILLRVGGFYFFTANKISFGRILLDCTIGQR